MLQPLPLVRKLRHPSTPSTAVMRRMLRVRRQTTTERPPACRYTKATATASNRKHVCVEYHYRNVCVFSANAGHSTAPSPLPIRAAAAAAAANNFNNTRSTIRIRTFATPSQQTTPTAKSTLTHTRAHTHTAHAHARPTSAASASSEGAAAAAAGSQKSGHVHSWEEKATEPIFWDTGNSGKDLKHGDYTSQGLERDEKMTEERKGYRYQKEVHRLVGMGFKEEISKSTLDRYGGDVGKAINVLIHEQ
mmetsp:Transcript_3451/g.6445  ORF Transcript_3451/g.6445 Transcript_3451/m.6445 type:complete len:248 (+) Transcript_3451:139-882(+)